MNPNDPQTPPTEVLSPSEVEHLLSQVGDSDPPSDPSPGSEPAPKPGLESAQPYNFRQPAFLSATLLRKLRLRQDAFVSALASRLSMYLRMEFAAQITRLQTMSYRRFTGSMATPTHLSLFKLDPFRGICLLEIPPRLGLTIVDRLLGGAAVSVSGDRDLSEIEAALLDQVVQVILNEWCTHWGATQGLRPSLLGHENSGQFLQTAPHDTVMLVLSMEARMSDCQEQMQIGIPYYTIEPIVAQLNSSLDSSEKPAPSTSPAAPRWNHRLDDARIRLVAEWAGLELTAREMTRLKVGDVLQLSPQCAEQVQVRLARLPKFVGRLGTKGPNWAVELTQILHP